jgi:Flp pilus assembly pilin Flp
MLNWEYIRAQLLAFRREEGQTMAEYAVILAVIVLAVVVAITALSGGITEAINNIVEVLPGTDDGTGG